MKTKITILPSFLLILALISSISVEAQLPDKVLVGYWHNWNNLRIIDVDKRYNVIMLSFLEADKNNNSQDNSVNDLEFTPWPLSKATIIADIKEAQLRGKKILFSIGGANGSFKLNSEADKNTFVSKVKDFIQEYGVDGIDLDIEQKTYIQMKSNEGTINSPAPHLQYLIDGVKELMDWYSNAYGKKNSCNLKISRNHNHQA